MQSTCEFAANLQSEFLDEKKNSQSSFQQLQQGLESVNNSVMNIQEKIQATVDLEHPDFVKTHSESTELSFEYTTNSKSLVTASVTGTISLVDENDYAAARVDVSGTCLCSATAIAKQKIGVGNSVVLDAGTKMQVLLKSRAGQTVKFAVFPIKYNN